MCQAGNVDEGIRLEYIKKSLFNVIESVVNVLNRGVIEWKKETETKDFV